MPARRCEVCQDPGELTLTALPSLSAALLPLNSHHSGDGGVAIMGEQMQWRGKGRRSLPGPVYSHQQNHCYRFQGGDGSLEKGASTIRQQRLALDPR